ncbi:hypothetical protein [Polyangium sp. y55x31]|uniref:hypothetical protein n=1 Tax=Polyangium sp. y55x31 TaxID=3042688 RepID=UPI0024829C7A|nr:hypothetical protein [Polyangium sp. y55x31]MDI1483440.1 hypothetical protein [Polyangium sp. y55x31]
MQRGLCSETYLRRAAVVACAAALCFAPAPAAAEPTIADRNAARSLASKAADLFDAGRYADSIEQFRQAEALVHAPPHVLYVARAYDKLGKLVEAHKAYDEILTDPLITNTSPAAFRDARTSAETEKSSLLQRIPSVRLSITSPDTTRVQVTIDGKTIESALLADPILVNPGTHTIEATGRGLVSDVKRVTTSEGDRLNVSLSLRWQGPLYPAIAAFGAGGLGLGIGIVTGAIALSKVSELEERCPAKHCLPADRPVGDSARALGTASTVGFVLGTALVGAGVALALVRPFGRAPADEAAGTGVLRVQVGLGTMRVEGAF